MQNADYSRTTVQCLGLDGIGLLLMPVPRVGYVCLHGSKFEFGNKILLYGTWIGKLTTGSLFFDRRLIISE